MHGVRVGAGAYLRTAQQPVGSTPSLATSCATGAPALPYSMKLEQREVSSMTFTLHLAASSVLAAAVLRHSTVD